MQEMTIGQLAEAAEVNVETVRYYHRRGLLPLPPRPTGGIRRYPADVLRRLRFIKRSQSLGFSLDEVEALLSLHDGQTCRAARAIAEHRLTDVRQRMQDLSRLEAALATLVHRCSNVERKDVVPAHRHTHGRG
ncbi:mercuric resistance operon regulatory protein [Paraburkholderia xenovorans LB400]|uniref:Mercuric resistance operon regulatory protein n=1 Tax=Paraburkholderia xenovorans (strain LB400) TaxID=266265 RepID=Q13T94_PARXL|nr:transcriptional regulator, MerR family [Paraburkholderia xenovorans LB400]AIP31681.1 mercuric resistance operon regulatory protein [Paraburkholderia xenovorans LB400]